MLQQATDAYQRARQKTASPRELEAALLLAAAAHLQAAIKPEPLTGDACRAAARAISFNCKIWTILVTSALRGQSTLPAPIRQSVTELGLFVIDRTARINTAGGILSASDVAVLIEINRHIAAGLRPPAAV
jgi:flagellar protein FlaF